MLSLIFFTYEHPNFLHTNLNKDAGQSYTDLQEEKERHLDTILEKLVGNPVHLYCLVHRMVKQLPSIRKLLADDPKTASMAEAMNKMLDQVEMVGEQDMVLVTQALARIQFAYRQGITNISKSQGIRNNCAGLTLWTLQMA